MREIVRTTQFKRDFKKVSRSGRYAVSDFLEVVDMLARDVPLPIKYCDHALSGEWSGFRECHIKPDWLLIYEKPKGKLVLILARTGSHSELF
jgi:mRNA interferase YafQ